MVAADSRWRLRDGTRLDRVAGLAKATRERLASEGEEPPAADAAVVSRPGARTALLLVDPDAADLLERFGEGKSVAQAVLDLARSRDLDPHELLEASLPAVERLVGKGYLVDADSPPSTLGYQIGDTMEGREAEWHIVRVLARLEDSEVHLVRRDVDFGTWGVLKISTPERHAGHTEHETEILRFVARRERELERPTGLVPSRLDEGALEVDGTEQSFLVLEFVRGVPVHQFARGLRMALRPEAAIRESLAALCVACARAFAELHRLGVAHGDVHPDNLLVAGSDAEPRVRLIDLGCARRLGDGRDLAPRPGIDNYREPEVASAIRGGMRAPAASPKGEQYALAVVLFQLLTGQAYLDFSADRAELLRQVAEDVPRTFEEVGVGEWPEMKAVLRRALSKDPEDRFEAMDAFAEALAAVPATGAEDRHVARTVGKKSDLERAVAKTLRRAQPQGPWWSAQATRRRPTTIFFGTAGLAWGLLHAAVRRADSEVLALADLWAHRALRDEEASVEIPKPAGRLPRLTSAPFHGAAGVHETAACVAWGLGDLRTFSRQARKFLKASASPPDEALSEAAERDLDVDLALGRPGSLISAAHLLDRARPPHPDASVASAKDDPAGSARKDRFDLAGLALELRLYGDEALDELWSRLDRRQAISQDDAWLGMAHGWAGTLYATLVWCRAANRALPAGFESRLEQLAQKAIPHGRGLRWTRERRGRSPAPAVGRDSMAGWCHGSAGYVLLFDTAARWPQLSRFRDTAEFAAWDVWDRFVVSPRQASHLCCGLIGQAWSLLVHARETGDESWIDRAWTQAEWAARHPAFDTSSDANSEFFDGALFKGEGSLPALLADLENPAAVVWPWLEDLECPGPT